MNDINGLRFLCLNLVLFVVLGAAHAQYSIEGQLDDPEFKWDKVYLQYMNSIKSIYKADVNNMLNVAEIDSTGYFKLEGIGLPEETSLYHLLLQKKGENNGYGISSGLYKSFLIIALKGDTHLKLICSNSSNTFAFCEFESSPVNEAISFLFDEIDYKNNLERVAKKNSQSEIHKQFLDKQYTDALKHFADTCQFPLVSMLAIQLIKDFETEFVNDRAYFLAFADKIASLAPQNAYAIETRILIKSLDARHFGISRDYSKNLAIAFASLSLLLALGLLFLGLKNRKLVKELRQYENPASTSANQLLETLSPKELEVLHLIGSGKSNKEIATALFIELSTVKSHVNKIYQKLGIRNRKEAQKWAKHLD